MELEFRSSLWLLEEVCQLKGAERCERLLKLLEVLGRGLIGEVLVELRSSWILLMFWRLGF